MAGLFWSYFRERLAWPWIFRPGPLAVIARGLADYLDTVREDIRWTRDQWIVTTAEQELMQGYGASRGAPRTRHDDDARHRSRVERAYAWHAMGGTVEGLPRILEEYGYPGGRVRNLRDHNAELWAHFDVELLNPPALFGQADIEAVLDLVNEYKPARSVVGLVQFAGRGAAPLTLGAVLTTSVVVEHVVATGSEAPFPPAPLQAGVVAVQYVFVRHEVREVTS